MKVFTFALAGLLAIPALLSAQSPVVTRKGKLMELSFLLGKWEINSEGTNSAGERFTQKGVMSYQFDMDSTVIRNEREFYGSKSTEVSEKFYEYILFNPSRNMYEFIAFEYGAAGAPRYWFVDTKGKVIRYSFARWDSSKKLTIETIVTMKFVSENELVETFEDVAFETGARMELNTLKLKRKK